MSLSMPLMVVLRHAVLALLLVGVPMKPALAVACAIADAQSGLAAVGGDADGAAPSSAAGIELDGEPWCCPDSVCSDCCTQAATPVPALRPLVASMLAVAPPPALSIGFRPGVYPVAFRPPIAG